ncbi:hypothetical protein [Helicobacter pylori]|uniref:hypothetical protein n=1 Tax=Helicobacter pylori TaxID=210 RepID=UPI00165CD774|nr:hypothetical protein [Helicobacter pylori]
MRQEHETATSFNQLKAITQAFMLKNGVLTNATHQESDRTQERGAKPKTSAQTKIGRLNPTKRAFSERQNTAFRDNSQAIAKTSFKTKASHNANAFKTEQTNNNFKPGLAKHQENQKGGKENQKGGNNEA